MTTNRMENFTSDQKFIIIIKKKIEIGYKWITKDQAAFLKKQ